MDKIKVLVVDDSAYNRMAISQMLSSATGIAVAGSAHDGVDAIAKTLRLSPDVITLDLEMPNMDGFTFLRWLMKERPTPVLVLSSRSDSRSVFRALELGAVDFLAKPEARISRSIESIRDELVAKVQAVLNLEMAKVKSAIELLALEKAAPAPLKEDAGRSRKGPVEVVAIGSSTGGPPAIQAIVSSLPADLGAAILVAQHMPPGFTKSFAERLNKLSSLMVFEAAAGDRISPGSVLIAPGGHHLAVKRDRGGLFAELVPRSPSDKYVPSADRMMTSVAEACGAAALAVVLTGMGKDGAEGVRAVKQRKGQCLAESEESAVIFGMPQEAIRTGSIDKVLPLAGMAEEILLRCRAAGSDPARADENSA
ncbi:MAG: chemotaxis response regulator protein-glutamate methylesterase [Nitrospirae bacterium GWD2_57_9]|nr:MAG: chemotaxis response regulator protein-glutamate methylesterase [Nitrospirae bacterium GWD2_57_9]OGW46941.1 MAG: chemotaxis response regulator protein-glutamate methylesterase [Nitrospirae bacterium GWC2_57_9]